MLIVSAAISAKCHIASLLAHYIFGSRMQISLPPSGSDIGFIKHEKSLLGNRENAKSRSFWIESGSDLSTSHAEVSSCSRRFLRFSGLLITDFDMWAGTQVRRNELFSKFFDVTMPDLGR